MNGILKTATKGKIQSPDLILIYGVDGVGKSSFAADAPNPIFVGPERGSEHLDVTRVPDIKTYEQIKKVLQELLESKHDFQTLVLDSVDWIEPMIHELVCSESKNQTKSLNNAHGGYGAGIDEANCYWRELFSQITALRDERKMKVIMIGHAQVKKFNDPQTNSEYDRFMLKLHDKTSPILREYVDCVLFANFEVYTKQDDKKKTRAYGEGGRLIYSERRPAYDAKNRYGLPTQFPLSWAEYTEARKIGKPESLEQVMTNINELSPQITDPELRKKVGETIKAAKGEYGQLVKIQNRLRTILNA